MIWKTCILQAKTDGAVDTLGNKTVSWTTVKTTVARLTPFDDSKIGLDGRKVTSNHQYFVLPHESVPECQRAVIANINYSIEELIQMPPRFVVMGCKLYKA